MNPKTQFIVVCGATATGKTDLAFDLAKKLKTEILSFDSIQVYKKLDIGAAKPSKEMLEQIPHHLIGEVDLGILFTAGDFRKKALAVIESLKDKRHLVLVGGTGFYLQALLKGMYDVPPVSDDTKSRVATMLSQRGSSALYQELLAIDPDYAETIHENDSYRVSRALELLFSGVKKISEIKNTFKEQPIANSVTMVGLRRKKENLRNAILSRTKTMLASGLIEETQALLKEHPEGLRSLKSVGYREAVDFLDGQMPEGELLEAIVQSTLQLAKRQNTWFKRDQRVSWFDPDLESIDSISTKALKLLL